MLTPTQKIPDSSDEEEEEWNTVEAAGKRRKIAKIVVPCTKCGKLLTGANQNTKCRRCPKCCARPDCRSESHKQQKVIKSLQQTENKERDADEFWSAAAKGEAYLQKVLHGGKFTESFLQKQQRMMTEIEKRNKEKCLNLSQEEKEEEAKTMATQEMAKEKREKTEDLVTKLIKKMCELVARVEVLEKAKDRTPSSGETEQKATSAKVAELVARVEQLDRAAKTVSREQNERRTQK